jgi:hypothetical protein
MNYSTLGKDNCLCGMKNCWKFVVLYYIILFCRIKFLISGYGGLLTPILFLSRKLIWYWQTLREGVDIENQHFDLVWVGWKLQFSLSVFFVNWLPTKGNLFLKGYFKCRHSEAPILKKCCRIVSDTHPIRIRSRYVPIRVSGEYRLNYYF